MALSIHGKSFLFASWIGASATKIVTTSMTDIEGQMHAFCHQIAVDENITIMDPQTGHPMQKTCNWKNPQLMFKGDDNYGTLITPVLAHLISVCMDSTDAPRLAFLYGDSKKERFKFVYGGDAMDRGKGNLRITASLVEFKIREPLRVVLITGNRDVAKLNISKDKEETSELADKLLGMAADGVNGRTLNEFFVGVYNAPIGAARVELIKKINGILQTQSTDDHELTKIRLQVILMKNRLESAPNGAKFLWGDLQEELQHVLGLDANDERLNDMNMLEILSQLVSPAHLSRISGLGPVGKGSEFDDDLESTYDVELQHIRLTFQGNFGKYIHNQFGTGKYIHNQFGSRTSRYGLPVARLSRDFKFVTLTAPWSLLYLMFSQIVHYDPSGLLVVHGDIAGRNPSMMHLDNPSRNEQITPIESALFTVPGTWNQLKSYDSKDADANIFTDSDFVEKVEGLVSGVEGDNVSTLPLAMRMLKIPQKADAQDTDRDSTISGLDPVSAWMNRMNRFQNAELYDFLLQPTYVEDYSAAELFEQSRFQLDPTTGKMPYHMQLFRGAARLLSYSAFSCPLAPTVIYSLHFDPDNRLMMYDDNISKELLDNSVSVVLKGHTPHGKSPAVMQSRVFDNKKLITVNHDIGYAAFSTASETRGRNVSAVTIESGGEDQLDSNRVDIHSMITGRTNDKYIVDILAISLSTQADKEQDLDVNQVVGGYLKLTNMTAENADVYQIKGVVGKGADRHYFLQQTVNSFDVKHMFLPYGENQQEGRVAVPNNNEYLVDGFYPAPQPEKGGIVEKVELSSFTVDSVEAVDGPVGTPLSMRQAFPVSVSQNVTATAPPALRTLLASRPMHENPKTSGVEGVGLNPRQFLAGAASEPQRQVMANRNPEMANTLPAIRLPMSKDQVGDEVPPSFTSGPDEEPRLQEITPIDSPTVSATIAKKQVLGQSTLMVNARKVLSSVPFNVTGNRRRS